MKNKENEIKHLFNKIYGNDIQIQFKRKVDRMLFYFTLCLDVIKNVEVSYVFNL